MNCYQHPDTVATAYCRSCGRAMCAACQFPAYGTVFCSEHAPQAQTAGATAAASQPTAAAPVSGVTPDNSPYAASPNPYAANPYAAPADPYVAPVITPAAPVTPTGGLQTSPGLAFLLGLIPGVGAIYNGQYAKGLMHAVIFGLLISLADAADNTSGQPMLVMCCVAFYCYMPIEAYHTARKRQLGLYVDEWSGLLGTRRGGRTIPVGPIAIILLGVLFLLHSLHVLDFHVIVRYWPVILIVAGIAMLISRLRNPGAEAQERPAAAPDILEPSREH